MIKAKHNVITMNVFLAKLPFPSDYIEPMLRRVQTISLACSVTNEAILTRLISSQFISRNTPGQNYHVGVQQEV